VSSWAELAGWDWCALALGAALCLALNGCDPGTKAEAPAEAPTLYTLTLNQGETLNQGDHASPMALGLTLTECAAAANSHNASKHYGSRVTNQWFGCEVETSELLAKAARQRAEFLDASEAAAKPKRVLGDWPSGGLRSGADVLDVAEGSKE